MITDFFCADFLLNVYNKNIKIIEIIADKMACVNFCKTNNETGILILFKRVIDCNIVESPPKPITKVVATTFQTE